MAAEDSTRNPRRSITIMLLAILFISTMASVGCLIAARFAEKNDHLKGNIFDLMSGNMPLDLDVPFLYMLTLAAMFSAGVSGLVIIILESTAMARGRNKIGSIALISLPLACAAAMYFYLRS